MSDKRNHERTRSLYIHSIICYIVSSLQNIIQSMPKHKFIYKEFHQVTHSCIQSFDTDDHDAWKKFRNEAIEYYDVNPNDFPENTPSDPLIWFNLLSKLDVYEFEETIDDCWTARKGGYPRSFELEDQNGTIIFSKDD